ncbi:mitochondrial peripheral inner membrane protein [Collariella sp. IMI 366227]|nr:mitochondrial peripheral inner membrane protein [Collariella sp. IMI 366227]
MTPTTTPLPLPTTPNGTTTTTDDTTLLRKAALPAPPFRHTTRFLLLLLGTTLGFEYLALLEGKGGEGVDMEVVWANRRREDCLGCDGEGKERQGAVVTMLEEFRERYGDRFRYSCTVDEEGSFIDAGVITKTTEVSSPDGKRPGWSFGGAAKAEPGSTLTVDSGYCAYHSAKALVVSDDGDAPVYEQEKPCLCKDINGKPVEGSKNLLFFSGPDGFIAHYVGAKVWGRGKELQGPVKGVVGALKTKYPSLAEDWLVLKM